MKFITAVKMVAAVLVLSLTMPALALNLQQAMGALGNAKAQGLVGEQPDGYLGVVQEGGATAEIVQLINAARRAEYQRLAKDNGLALQDVESMAGLKAIEKTHSDHYILINGKWAKKP
jgi:uncharacterized protein YdbL (DUF1318 family)